MGFTTHDPHDTEWETGSGLRTIATQDDEEFCDKCGEFFFDDGAGCPGCEDDE